MMGDNRNNSADSRRHVADQRSGTVPVSNVIGKARVIVLPLSRWQAIADPNPQGAKAVSEPAARTSSTPSGPTRGPVGLPLGAGLLLGWPVLRGGQALRDRVIARRRG
jgi:signal peptidase I